MKFNPFNRKLLMQSAIDTYYSSIGVIPKDTRETTQVKARNAIGVALLQWADGQQEVAEMLGRDRSTIAHMYIGHEDNLKFWKGYSEMYEKATMIVDNRMSTTNKAQRLADLTNKISMLEQEAAILRTELNSNPTSQA